MSDPCQLFENLNFADTDPIAEKIRINALKNCTPLNVTIELTQNCNFKCEHCYNFDRSNQDISRDITSKTLTLEQWKNIVFQIREMGCFYLCLTGGEVLLYPHLNSLIEFSKNKGLSIRLKTNGSLLTKEKAFELKRLGIDDIEFSLYGATSITHDEFTNSRGQFLKVIEGMKWAKEYKLNPMCNIILHKGSVSEFSKMIALVKKLEVPFQVSMDISAQHDGSSKALQYRPSVSDLRGIFTSEVGEFLLPFENVTGNIQCACARSNCGIGYDGSVYPCIGAPLLSGTLKDQSFREIWLNSPVLNRIRKLKLKDYKDCFDCSDRNFCQRSSGLIYVNTGNYTGAEQQTCETAKLIKELNNSTL
jgi:radical SAM protein with 4Fe4S-binding SPASM domain